MDVDVYLRHARFLSSWEHNTSEWICIKTVIEWCT